MSLGIDEVTLFPLAVLADTNPHQTDSMAVSGEKLQLTFFHAPTIHNVAYQIQVQSVAGNWYTVASGTTTAGTVDAVTMPNPRIARVILTAALAGAQTECWARSSGG